jgi:hypothetical protein
MCRGAGVGTLAALVLFASPRDVVTLEERFNRIDWPAIYGSIHLKNTSYGLDTEIKLLIKYAGQRSLSGVVNTFHFTMDIPVQHMSLEGPFDVKEMREVTLHLFGENELLGYALVVSRRKDVFRYFGYAMDKVARLKLYNVKLNVSEVELDELAKTFGGNISWLVISEIRDTELDAAQFFGMRLEESEIVSDVVRRGRVRALKIVDPTHKLTLTLSGSGRIYTPRSGISVHTLAATVAPLLKMLHEKRVLAKGSPLGQLPKPL